MRKILMTAAACLLAVGTAASAATLNISGGSAGVIPGGTATNHILNSIPGLSAPLSGSFGSTITASDVNAGDKVRVELIGYEAGYTNSFTMGGSNFSKTGVASVTDLTSNLGEFVVDLASVVSGGVLDFVFNSVSSNTGNAIGSVANGGDNLGTDPFNFFASKDDLGRIWLFLDDSGSGPDDNHDDLVVRISAVPLPAGLLLMLTGVGALSLRRRKKAA